MSTTEKSSKAWKGPLFWALLIILYIYWHLIPEVTFVNGSGTRVEHIEISLVDDNKVYRHIEHGASKNFRYHPRSSGGSYEIKIIMLDGSIFKESINIIQPWNFGHKVVFELLPDSSLRVDRSYSVFDGA